ncbi:MAG: hypothetical protein ACI9YL_001431 [Luteibaculaceae bacterium]|jgi:hypothetical protein
MRLTIFLLFASSSLLSQSQGLEIYVRDAGNVNLPPWQILVFDENGNNGNLGTNPSNE